MLFLEFLLLDELLRKPKKDHHELDTIKVVKKIYKRLKRISSFISKG